MVVALRRALEAGGYTVDAVRPGAGIAALPPEGYTAAIVHQGGDGIELVRALRDLDPLLPIIELYLDEEEAQEASAQAAEMGADGVLIGPLSDPAVRGVVRMAERLRRALRRAAELEAVAARRVDSAQELAFLKRMLLLEVKRSKRYVYPVAVSLFAVDRWPELIAAHTAQERAALLGDLLALLASSVRDIDLACPFGEDRLVVLMPHTTAESALRVASRIVGRIRARDHGIPVTVSAGVAGHPGGGTISFGNLAKRATAALARAREAGGDRAQPAEPPPKRDRVSMG